MIIGKKILRYQTIDSTNQEARRLIAKGSGEEGTVLVAATQTKGEGKLGSVWHSPVGNLYFSCIIKPHKNPQQLAPFTFLAALAVYRVLTGYCLKGLIIKWPNDVLVNGKKICGILTERLASGQLIVGIGLNVNTNKGDFPPILRRSATSLLLERGKQTALSPLLRKILAELEVEYLAYLFKVC